MSVAVNRGTETQWTYAFSLDLDRSLNSQMGSKVLTHA